MSAMARQCCNATPTCLRRNISGTSKAAASVTLTAINATAPNSGTATRVKRNDAPQSSPSTVMPIRCR